MTPAEILIHLRSLNVELTVHGESLRYSAPAGVMTPTMRSMLQQNKAELVKLLQDAHHIA